MGHECAITLVVPGSTFFLELATCCSCKGQNSVHIEVACDRPWIMDHPRRAHGRVTNVMMMVPRPAVSLGVSRFVSLACGLKHHVSQAARAAYLLRLFIGTA